MTSLLLDVVEVVPRAGVELVDSRAADQPVAARPPSTAAARGALRMAEPPAEDALAAADLLGVTPAQGPRDDPFDARDPEYIRQTQVIGPDGKRRP